MSEDFSTFKSALNSPARDASVITPSDVSPLSEAVRGIYVGGGGSMRVRMVSGNVVDFTGLQGGVVYPLRADQILATGTSATGLVGLR